tara:strand:- start:509 stop:682 length:174 start_codon:yes stop_codon:yes gene_type:complete
MNKKQHTTKDRFKILESTATALYVSVMKINDRLNSIEKILLDNKLVEPKKENIKEKS